MNTGHPTYPHPTIIEAICDIHFRLPESQEWKPSLPGEFFKRIQHEYPEMEPVLEMGLHLEVGPSGTSAKVLPPPQKVRFKHRTRSLVLQLAENALSISVLPPYQGWNAMRTDALAAWKQLKEVLKPELISRLGLRYINRIEKETNQDRLGNWLVATEYIPAAILSSAPGFLLRIETHLDSENMLIITIGDTKTETENAYGAMIFDIDRIVEREIIAGQEMLEGEMDRLHGDIWSVFSSAKGARLDAFLNRRQQ